MAGQTVMPHRPIVECGSTYLKVKTDADVDRYMDQLRASARRAPKLHE
jgi:hypothetical protein